MSVKETVYPPYGNTAKFRVKVIDPETGEALVDPLSEVTRIVCKLSPSNITIDSQETPAAITWTANRLIFSLGYLTELSGDEKATLITYSPSEPGGLLLAEPKGENNRCTFRFKHV